LSKVKAARKAHEKDEKEHVQDAVDALMDIRASMERFNDRDSQSFGESSPHSSNQKTTTSSPGQTTDGFSSAGSKRKSRPPPVVFKESFAAKQERVRKKSAYGSHPGWRLLPILIKSNDDLRQEELASQLIFRMASILAKAKVPVWLCPYQIIALTESGGVIEVSMCIASFSCQI
jgi:phosphatidylinositol kinase/protein kinase (PI-3  family)